MGLALQLAGAIAITGFAGAAPVSLGLGCGVLRAKLPVAEGVIGGLGIMTAATLLRTIGIRTWHQMLMFTLITLPAHPLEEIVRTEEAASFSKFSLDGHSNFLFKQRS